MKDKTSDSHKKTTTQLPPLAHHSAKEVSTSRISATASTRHENHQPYTPKAPTTSKSSSTRHNPRRVATKPTAEQLEILKLQETIQQQAQKIGYLQSDMGRLEEDRQYAIKNGEYIRSRLLAEIAERDRIRQSIEQEKEEISVKLSALIGYLASCSDRYGNKWRSVLKPPKTAGKLIHASIAHLDDQRVTTTLPPQRAAVPASPSDTIQLDASFSVSSEELSSFGESNPSLSPMSDLTDTIEISLSLDASGIQDESMTVDPHATAKATRIRAPRADITAPDSWEACQTLLRIADELLTEAQGETDLNIMAKIHADIDSIVAFLKNYTPPLEAVPEAATKPVRRHAMAGVFNQITNETHSLNKADVNSMPAKSPCRDPKKVKKFLYNNDGKRGWVPDFLQATTPEQLHRLKQQLELFLSTSETQQAMDELHAGFLLTIPLTADDHRNDYIKKNLHHYFVKISGLKGLEQITYSIDLASLNRAPTRTDVIIAATAPNREPFSREALLKSFAAHHDNFLDDLKKQLANAKPYSQIDYGVLNKVFGNSRDFADLFAFDSYLGNYKVNDKNLKEALHRTDRALQESRKTQNFDHILIEFKALCTALIALKEDRSKLSKADRLKYDGKLETDLQTSFDAWRQANLPQNTVTATVNPTSLAGIFPTVLDDEKSVTTVAPVHNERILTDFLYGPKNAFASDLLQQFADANAHEIDYSRLKMLSKTDVFMAIFEKDLLSGLYIDPRLNHLNSLFRTLRTSEDSHAFMKHFNTFYYHVMQILLPTMDRHFLKSELSHAFQQWQVQHARGVDSEHIASAASPLTHVIDSVQNDHHEHHTKSLIAAEKLKPGLHEELEVM